MGKTIKYNYEEWIEKISKDLPEDYQIGLHQVGVFGTEESKKAVRKGNPITYFRKIKPKDYCKSIMKTGLRNRWEDIMYTLYQFGSVDKIKNNNIRREEFLNYEYDDLSQHSKKELYDIIVAIPRQVIVGGDEYLLGHLSYLSDMDKPEESAGKRIFYKSDIPKEFIYGYIYKHDGIVEFTPNEQHINMKTAEKQERFFEEIVREKNIEPIKEEKENTDSYEKEKRGPIEALKEMQIERQKEILSLLEEKAKISEKSVSLIPYKKFGFFEKHIFKRREYRQYMQDRKNEMESINKAKNENSKRLQEINKLLLKEGFPSISSVKQKIDEFSKATTIQELGMENPNKAIEMLVAEGIDFEFESLQQAFELTPEFFGENVEFMKKAVREDVKFIKYDKTNNEELYKEFIEIKIKYLEAKKEDGNLLDDESSSINDELEELYYFREELESPKKVEEGKYKLPHQFMFEELRNNEGRKTPRYYYRSVDGVYDIEFGEELEKLYENPDIIIGVHGLRENAEIENLIFTKGLKNSMQDADVALSRTVAFGENMTFTKLLNYRIPYNGQESETAVILKLPKNVLDKENPVPIWGSHDPKGSDNYILPEYVYGLYHSKSDGENRRIIKNTHENQEKYEYLKYDANSSKGGIVEEVEKQQNNIEV